MAVAAVAVVVGSSEEGTGTIGYWKNHASAWPVDEIELGGVVYTKHDALELLATPVRGDATISLVQQLIAAKLNVENGTESSCIDATIAAADAFLASHPVGSKPKGSAQHTADDLKDRLDDYNNGRLCAPAPRLTAVATNAPGFQRSPERVEPSSTLAGHETCT